MVIMAAVGATTQDKMLMVSLSECQTLITSLKKQFSLTKSYCPKKKKNVIMLSQRRGILVSYLFHVVIGIKQVMPCYY